MMRRLQDADFQMTAIEPDVEGYQTAKQASPEVEVHNLGVYDDAFSLGNFDAVMVISSEVIEHLYDRAASLRLACRHLETDGSVVLSCPCHGYAKNLLLSLANRWDDHLQPARVGGHIKLWSHRTMGSFLEANGIQVKLLSGAAVASKQKNQDRD